MKKFFNVKTISLILAVILLVGGAVGGTLAWIIDTKSVTNTFTIGDINITLDETDIDKSTAGVERDTENTYKIVPGGTYTKDPLVTVKGNSQACYLFVELTETPAFDKFMTYAIADGWTLVDGETSVYHRTVSESASDQKFDVLKDNKVSVLNTVKKSDLSALTDNTATLKVTAYAIQSENLNVTDIKDIWTIAKDTSNH